VQCLLIQRLHLCLGVLLECDDIPFQIRIERLCLLKIFVRFRVLPVCRMCPLFLGERLPSLFLACLVGLCRSEVHLGLGFLARVPILAFLFLRRFRMLLV